MADADSWDADNFQPEEPVTKAPVRLLDRWEGEDEEEDVKDNWDDEEEEKEVKEDKPAVKTEVSGKKKLIEKIKEKERKKEETKLRIEKEALTPEDEAAEKLRVKKLQEESDLELANDAFGVTNSVPVGSTTTGIDALNPNSKEDFTELNRLLKEKISQYERSVHYSGFLESLFRDLCISLEVDDLKKISTSLTVLLNEKQKQEKQNKAKKKKKSVLPGGGLKGKLRDDLVDYGEFDGGYTQDFEDFM